MIVQHFAVTAGLARPPGFPRRASPLDDDPGPVPGSSPDPCGDLSDHVRSDLKPRARHDPLTSGGRYDAARAVASSMPRDQAPPGSL